MRCDQAYVSLLLQGKKLTVGFKESDYNWSIGEAWCTDIEVTWNEISCLPPDELPGYRKKRSFHLIRIPRQSQDEPEDLRTSNDGASLNHKTLLEMSINLKHNAESVLPQMHRQPYNVPNNSNGKNHVHFVNPPSAKAPAADQGNKLRRKRQIRNVQVDIIVHAGANLKINAGSIIYRIPEKPTTQTTPTVPTSNPNLTSPTEREPAAGDSNKVTVIASVFGVLAFIGIAAALGNNRYIFVQRLHKLIYLHLFSVCFMKILFQSSEQI